jgi:regulator of protease activity HflC (stomatin/prohibitin superfamily)
MGAQRDALAESLRASLARDIAAYQAGIEIVSLHIESVHPPAGAAAAYHAVQAAEINARASVFNETGRARRMAGVAQTEAHQLTASAEASGREKTETAKGEAYRFTADRNAYSEGSKPFLLERTFSSLVAALTQVRLTIVDSRLNGGQAPVIDLRGLESTTAAPAMAPPPTRAPAPARPALTPGVEDTNKF